MSFSFCLKEDELLVMAGLGILWQIIDLEKNSKLLRDHENTISVVTGILDRHSAPGSVEFRRFSRSLITMQLESPHTERKILQRSASSTANTDPIHVRARRELQKIAFRYSQAARETASLRTANDEIKRPGLPSASAPHLPSIDHTKSFRPIAPSTNHHDSSASSIDSLTSGGLSSPTAMLPPRRKDCAAGRSLNLDYFSFSNQPTPGSDMQQYIPQKDGVLPRGNTETPEWEQLLSTLNPNPWRPLRNVPGTLQDQPLNDVKPNLQDPASELYDIQKDLFDAPGQQKSQSNVNYSEESLTSGAEEFSSVDIGSAGSDNALRAMMMPALTPEEFGPSQVDKHD